MPTFVPAAARAMNLLEIFARERRELTNSELARLMDLAESSCSDLLYTLLQLGYLTRTTNTKRFYPTNRLLAQATAIGSNNPLLAIGLEGTDLLSQKTGETATCGTLDGESVLIVAMHEGSHRLRYQRSAGDRISLHASASGKAILAQLDGTERARLLRLRPLKAMTELTKTNPAEVEMELNTSSKLGWFMSRGEATDGASALAVAGRIGSDILSLSIIGPSERFDANKKFYVDTLLEVGELMFEGGLKKAEVRDEQISARPPRTEGKVVRRGRPPRQ